MTTRAKWIVGVLVVLVVVVVVVLVVASQSRGPNAGSTVRVRVSGGGSRPADATFTRDSEGRYPGEPGWVDEGADVEVG